MEASHKNSAGLVSGLVIKALPGSLYSASGFNTGAAQYIQVYDLAAAPTSQKPIMVVKAEADSAFYFDMWRIPRKCANGIFITNSSTAATYTAGGNDCLFDATYA